MPKKYPGEHNELVSEDCRGIDPFHDRPHRLLALQLCPHRNALTLLWHVFLIMGRHGIPQAMGNDPLFTGRLFRWGLALAGMGRQRTMPGCH